MVEETVATALRLSEKAKEKLMPEIKRQVKNARLDLIRVGVSEVKANENEGLIEEAIVTYCLSKLGPEDKREAWAESYESQADALRKSRIYREKNDE